MGWGWSLFFRDGIEALYWFLQKDCPCTVPTGLRSEFVAFRFPTLKRGANKLCASGAAERTQKDVSTRVWVLL
jgi:hypothetical protein